MTPAELKDLLWEHRLTQQQIADNLGVSRQVVNHWCNHNVPKPWIIVLKQYFKDVNEKRFDNVKSI